MPEVPRRLRPVQRIRKLERAVADLKRGKTGNYGIIEGSTVYVDENETVRVAIGQVGTESNPQYDVLLFDENGNLVASLASGVGGGGGGGDGVTDHGALTGLADDDHAQYTTAAELAAAIASALSPVTSPDYLVGTAQAGLSGEIVVGTTPGGELGGTWASPTVDATHAGSAHLALGTTGTTAAAGNHGHYALAPLEVLWDSATDWNRFGTKYFLSTPDGTGTTGLTFSTTLQATPTVPDATGALVSAGTSLGRVTHPGGGAPSGAAQRTWYLLDGSDCLDSEVTTLIYARGDHPQGGQMGNVHRAQINPATGRPWGFVVWFDIAFGLDWVMNIGAWTTSTNAGANREDVSFPAPTMTGYGQPVLQSVRNKISVHAFTRSGTSMTLLVNPDHDVQTGDVLELRGTSIDTSNLVVTGTFGSAIILATHPSSGTIDSGTHTHSMVNTGGTHQHTALNTTGGPHGHTITTGEGSHTHAPALMLNGRRSMPYFLKSRLTGTGSNTVLRFKAWRRGYPEPDWSDPVAAGKAVGGTGPTTAGKCGVLAGHVDNNTKFCDFGTIRIAPLA